MKQQIFKGSFLLALVSVVIAGGGQPACAISRNGLTNLYANRFEANYAIPAERHDSVVNVLGRQIARMEAVTQLKGSDRRKRPGEVRKITEETRAALLPLIDSSKRKELENPADPLLPSLRILELNDQLELSAEQIGKIELILKDAGPEMQMPEGREMRQGGPGGPGGQQSGPPPDMEKMHDQMDKRREQMKLTDTAIEQVLTEDQKRVFQKIKKDREEQMRGGRPEGRDGDEPGGGDPGGGGRPF